MTIWYITLSYDNISTHYIMYRRKRTLTLGSWDPPTVSSESDDEQSTLCHWCLFSSLAKKCHLSLLNVWLWLVLFLHFNNYNKTKSSKLGHIYPSHVAEVPAGQTLYLLLLQTGLGAELTGEFTQANRVKVVASFGLHLENTIKMVSNNDIKNLFFVH